MQAKTRSRNYVRVLEKHDASGTYWEIQVNGRYVTDHYNKERAYEEAKELQECYG